MSVAVKERVVWSPQPGPQHALITCPYSLVGFGGARGGGKTDGVLGKYAIKAERYGRAFNAVFFRKEMPQADDLIERAKEIYLPLGADWHDQKKLFTMPHGGRVRFRPLENDADAEKYQGQNVTDAAVEEAGNYGDPAPIFKLFGALRSKSAVPIQLILTFNPGGPGHHWLKNGTTDTGGRTVFPGFIRPAPLGRQRLQWQLPNDKVVNYVFIPSRVGDNKILMQNDPEYVDRLHMVGSPELVRAWVEGDWNVIQGSYFPEFGVRHIVEPFTIPKHWTARYVGFDWGYNSPFCAVWGAISSGKFDDGRECPYPKNSIVIYRECWGKGVDNFDIASRIVALSRDESPIMVADPSIFAHDGGPSIADQFKSHGVSFRPADNERVGGWSQIRQRLKPKPAMLYIFSSCPYLLETLPALAIDQKKPEDLDTTGEDHAADALRYLCKERLLESILEVKSEPVSQGVVKVQEYISRIRRDQTRTRI